LQHDDQKNKTPLATITLAFLGAKKMTYCHHIMREKNKSLCLDIRLYNMSPKYSIIPKLFYFLPQHVAKFGEVFFCMITNQPTSQIWKENTLMPSFYIFIFPSFNVLALVYCTPIMNKYAYHKIIQIQKRQADLFMFGILS
jgi:hypothetical protein